MTDRIKAMREALYTRLKAKGTPGTWEHITSHIGMFTFSGMTGTEVHACNYSHYYWLVHCELTNRSNYYTFYYYKVHSYRPPH